MNTITILLSALLAVLPLDETAYNSYIEKYASVAVSEMHRSGIPASITLAQGLLESSAGNSPLAVEGNNHFGIKCHRTWTGRTISHDDDELNECFRAYDSALESFRDHSDYLRYYDRYKSLFNNKAGDYQAWAYGLKAAGYATDPSYPQKLITLIEHFNLSRFDTVSEGEPLPEAPLSMEEAVRVEENAPAAEVKEEPAVVETAPEIDNKSKVKAEKKSDKHKGKLSGRQAEKQAGSKADARAGKQTGSLADGRVQKKFVARQYETLEVNFGRLFRKNGVDCIFTLEGETYSSIAAEYGLSLRKLLQINELEKSEDLLPGTLVYISPKKNHTPRGLDKYIVGDESETLRGISQRFGVKLSSILKMNGFDESYRPAPGDEILLRK